MHEQEIGPENDIFAKLAAKEPPIDDDATDEMAVGVTEEELDSAVQGAIIEEELKQMGNEQPTRRRRGLFSRRG